jgi:gentisate 1,2-dioxygenase
VGQNTDLERFYDCLEEQNLGALWKDLALMCSKTPAPKDKSCHWNWTELRELLLQAEFLPLGKDAERRVIYLQNPQLKKLGVIGGTTTTLYTGVQLLLPGEVAPAHRHTQAAIRFIIEGEGAFTTINGDRVPMSPGDLILTPAGVWHDHGHTGDKPVIWMDGLDVGIVNHFNASFFEGYEHDFQTPDAIADRSYLRYGNGAFRSINATSQVGENYSLLKFKWEDAQASIKKLEALGDINPFDGYGIEYRDPRTGHHADKRLGTQLQMLPVGFNSAAHRHVHSSVFHVKSGQGFSMVDGQKVEWSTGDFFTIPAWAVHSHVNSGGEEAYLFSINDRPALELLGLERELAISNI